MGTKFPFFNFPAYKIYLATWARRARGDVEHVRHVGMLGTPFSRLSIDRGMQIPVAYSG